MNRLEALLYCLFLALTFFCYKSLIPAPISYYTEKVSVSVKENIQNIKQKMVNWSKSRYVQEMKSSWPLAANFVASYAGISSYIILFALRKSHYDKTRLFALWTLVPSAIIVLLTNDYWQDYLDRVWLEEYKKDNYEK